MNIPSRLWSQENMLKQWASTYLNCGAIMSSISAAYQIGNHTPGGQEWEPDQVESIKVYFKDLIKVCEQLGLNVSKSLLSKYVDSASTIPSSTESFEILMQSVRTEMDSKYFLYMENHRAAYFENKNLVSDKVKEAFPSIIYELTMGANCYAFELDTACVFHCMRAAELGLRTMATSLEINYPHPIELLDWSDVLNPMQKAIKEKQKQPKSKERTEELQFYSEAASQCQYFKDGWRNSVSHVRAVYTDQQAKDVLDHTCKFFEVISTRLSE